MCMCVYAFSLCIGCVCDCGVGGTVSVRLVIARVETSSIIAWFFLLLIMKLPTDDDDDQYTIVVDYCIFSRACSMLLVYY